MTQRNLRRRDLLAAGPLVLGASACSRRGPRPRPAVSVLRAGNYDGNLERLVREAIAAHRLDVRGKRVLLKPNLVEFEAATCINTHPALVGAALEAFRAAGAADVRIAEGPGHRRDSMELAEAAGFLEAIPRFEEIFTDLNLDDVTRVDFRRPLSRLRSVYLPNTFLGSDLVVSMPKMKTHHWVGATLSIKNLFGCVPGNIYGWPKNILHWSGIHECIADLHRLEGRRFAIVDGILGMEGNGPIQGTPKQAGVIVAGSDLAAVDATCCRIMGIDPRKVRYLKLVEDRGQTDEAAVKQIGESLRAVATRFELIRRFASLRLNT